MLNPVSISQQSSGTQPCCPSVCVCINSPSLRLPPLQRSSIGSLTHCLVCSSGVSVSLPHTVCNLPRGHTVALVSLATIDTASVPRGTAWGLFTHWQLHYTPIPPPRPPSIRVTYNGQWVAECQACFNAPALIRFGLDYCSLTCNVDRLSRQVNMPLHWCIPAALIPRDECQVS